MTAAEKSAAPQKITTFFMFSEGAGEAMNFYVSVFRNSKIISTMPGPGGTVMGGTFELEGQRFNAFNGGSHFSFTSGVSQFVSCDSQDEIDYYYEKLSEGGEKQPCGWLKDQFGVSWQIIPPVLSELLSDPDREKAGRVMNAMLKMRKIDIQALKDAAG
ncbi:MAG: VOC family protein [Acidobacteria bacterium]|nr:VOC family protein [Acidobacteriota bacterium]